MNGTPPDKGFGKKENKGNAIRPKEICYSALTEIIKRKINNMF